MDEQSARNKALTKIALGHAANSLKRGKQQSMGWSKGNHRNKQQNKNTANANATTTSSGKSIICYNCGEPGHISPNCPNPKQTSSMTTQYNKSCAAAASTTSSDLDSTTNKLVCSA